MTTKTPKMATKLDVIFYRLSALTPTLSSPKSPPILVPSLMETVTMESQNTKTDLSSLNFTFTAIVDIKKNTNFGFVMKSRTLEHSR